MCADSACLMFDLDGTLIDSDQIWRDARREFAIANDGRWDSGAQAALMGMRTDAWANYNHDALERLARGTAFAPRTSRSCRSSRFRTREFPLETEATT